MWKLTQLIWLSFLYSPTLTNTCLSPRLETNPSLWILTLNSIIIQWKNRNKVRNVNLFVVDADSNIFSSLFLWMPFSILEYNSSFLTGFRHFNIWLVIWQYTFSHITTYTYPCNLDLDEFLSLRFSLCVLQQPPEVYTIKTMAFLSHFVSLILTQYLCILFHFRY